RHLYKCLNRQLQNYCSAPCKCRHWYLVPPPNAASPNQQLMIGLRVKDVREIESSVITAQLRASDHGPAGEIKSVAVGAQRTMINFQPVRRDVRIRYEPIQTRAGRDRVITAITAVHVNPCGVGCGL